MKATLCFRFYGQYKPLKEFEMNVDCKEIIKKIPDPNYGSGYDYEINEKKLIEHLPREIIDFPLDKCLLCVQTPEGLGQGISPLKYFRSFQKYFHSKAIILEYEENP